ncbi:MAG: formimidoylglutamase [Rhodoblastus sp.]|nr:MAG: formimidoylglutamase [Rhodoblastus sp.]
MAGDRHEIGPVHRVKDVLKPLRDEVGPGFALLGFACDEGVRRNMGRVGAAEGPAAIRRRLARLPVHEVAPILDAGSVSCVGADLESAQERLARAVAALVRRGFTPLVLGGGHEVAFGSFCGLIDGLGEAGDGRRVGILNIDAHFDLRHAPERSSGTPFLDIATRLRAAGRGFHYLCVGIGAQANTAALFERADALGVRYWLDEDCRAPALGATLEGIDQALATFDDLYLTIDLDALQAAIAPGVSAPSPGGISLEALEAVVDLARASGKLRLVDIAECNPLVDRDEATAAVAARLVWRLLFSGEARRRRS